MKTKALKSMAHDSASTHVTGQSEYIDDRPATAKEIFVDIIFSTESAAKFEIDLSHVNSQPGVLATYTAKDFHDNLWGSIFKEQPLLADKVVTFAGEPIALVAAETQEAARLARKFAKITYIPTAAIRTVKEAINKKSFIGPLRKIECGNVRQAFENVPLEHSGEIIIRGADHFYLESNAAIVYPHESGQLEVHSSSQHPTETQHVVAHALGLAQNKVVCVVKRMGGAFGGKETQAAPFAAYAALIAHKLNRPARLVLTKDDDMIITGKRNPFESYYRVGYDKHGRILALDVQLYSDGGAYADLSTSIMERAMLHIDNAYQIENLRVTGQVCRTNFHPHTAFRGFGGPKGVATIERIIEEVAHRLKKDPLEVRKLNCYKDDAVTHYGQTLENNCLPELFEKLEKDCDYQARRQQIEKHNQSQSTLKGISLTPVKFGISFTTRFLNQANALVIINRDGSVQVSTGATEMGQGVNARIAQLVASELGLSREQILMMPTSTDKNGNTSPTAASSGTDLNGGAALIATRKIKARLSQLATQLFGKPKDQWARNTAGLGTENEICVTTPQLPEDDANSHADWHSGSATFDGVTFSNGFVFKNGKGEANKISFSDLVNEAYLNRISLTDYAHYRFPHLTFNKLTGQGRAFLYYTNGVACSEVEINRYTGEVKVQRVDILMDLGRPINEGLDIGQVTGGFVQGMGWVTTEKLFYNQKGLLLSHSPSTYKIPNVQDTPRIFNARLIPNDKNKPNVRGTKAAGEPPLLLALSVWTAIHDAVKALPQYENKFPKIELPATSEEILRAIYPQRFAQLK